MVVRPQPLSRLDFAQDHHLRVVLQDLLVDGVSLLGELQVGIGLARLDRRFLLPDSA